MIRTLQGSTQTVPDTVLLAQTGLESAADVAMVIVAVMTVAILLGVLFAVLQIRKLVVKMREMLGRVEPQVHPLLERARGASENVEYITRAVRTDVERLTGSVEALTGRLNQASDRMEERIEEFNALMEVVQLEAEGLFVQTASTVRGVRAGAEALGRSQRAELPPAAESVQGSDAPEPDSAG